MTIQPEVRFESGFPDDAVYDAEGYVTVQPGRNIAELLKTALEEADYRVSDPIEVGDHGWELDIWRGRKRLWLQITAFDPDECYLVAENMTFWLWPDVDLFRTFLSDLHRSLQADIRFRLVGWLPKGGINSNAAPAGGPLGA